ncbi:septum site-determining protein MinC [Bacillus sp. FJAT-27225]|uniref:septum site-determining protein MinC n=1 Tax=Bacillus sp. FJAT-27225 TaxID=1743144 RepID=UPI00080C3388|nr:septum site-determining protein MinC [Bacillus sp. FJAT-27225]OCA91564.1 septum site-determining protein MinC [Bacillus sp. FJAT-27225]
MSKRQHVTIKGTKDGITLFLDDLCSYEELKKDLESKLSSHKNSSGDSQLLPVRVNAGNRYLTAGQQEELKELIRRKKHLVVETIESEVISRQEAKEQAEKSAVTTVAKMIRSGQVLEVPGDLVLIGDVNPGAVVMAGGNIFIMGILKGVAHAGCYGDTQAVIAASAMMPSQLRISQNVLTLQGKAGNDNLRDMECAYIDEENEITLGRLQSLASLRPGLTRLEGGR